MTPSTHTYEGPEVKMPGAGGHELWTFKATGPGESKILLHYVRSWEKDTPPADTNLFTVIVK